MFSRWCAAALSALFTACIIGVPLAARVPAALSGHRREMAGAQSATMPASLAARTLSPGSGEPAGRAGQSASKPAPPTPGKPPRSARPPATAATSRAAGDKSGLPPLLDRELFFGDPEVSGAQISPDGRFIAFLKPFKGTTNIWVKGAAESIAKARPLTAAANRPVAQFFWSRDSQFILFAQDQAGNETYNIYSVNPAAVPAASGEVPAARNLTDVRNVRATIIALPKGDPDCVYVGLNDRDPSWPDLYRIQISTGARILLRINTDRITGYVFDLKGRLRLMTRAPENGDTEILRVDPENKLTRIYGCSVFESCGAVQFHKDGARVYFQTNTGDGDLVRLTLLDVQSGVETLVESDPMKRVDLGVAQFSDRTDDLIATVYVDDRQRIYWKDDAFAADYKLLQAKLPGREIELGSSTLDERFFIVSARSDVDPGAAYLFDRKTRTLTLQYRLRPKLPSAALAAMAALHYPSSDRIDIPAYLTLPKGVPAKNLPLVVVPHGGPWMRAVWGYDPFAQFLANRGYAVLQPNFRGSTGFGKRFLDAGNRQWGDRMQDDLTWGVKHLVGQGTVDPTRVGILGASYGGYATLAGAAFTPDVYAAAVSMFGPSSLLTLLDSIPPYWDAGRRTFTERLGDRNTPEGTRQLERQSPLNSASRIRTPLLVVQGANDPRVNKRESEQIVVALRDRQLPVEYIVAPDEGHGFANPVNNTAVLAAAEKFLAKFLGGRFQDSMPPEVSARLKQMATDPRLVQAPAPAIPLTTPRPAVSLMPGTYTYRATIAAAGQSREMSVTTEITDEADGVVITDTAVTPASSGNPGGSVVDRALLDKKTLLLKRRTLSQGANQIDYAVLDGRASGQFVVNGQVRPFSAELGGDLFNDAAGIYHSIATLPFEPGYMISFRTFDVQEQRVRTVRLVAFGSETVTVPAGTFDAFKIELSTADDGAKTTVWVAKADRKVVKFVGLRPQLQGATVTSELVK